MDFFPHVQLELLIFQVVPLATCAVESCPLLLAQKNICVLTKSPLSHFFSRVWSFYSHCGLGQPCLVRLSFRLGQAQFWAGSGSVLGWVSPACSGSVSPQCRTWECRTDQPRIHRSSWTFPISIQQQLLLSCPNPHMQISTSLMKEE